ncbi:MAG: hypothetical protein NZ551_07960 [Microscillaceae bacterium]|nr:hypothetical protein [Microscillaceae bacterium]MDW8461131.1 hypothetical protein [Cytophagales bacterium]
MHRTRPHINKKALHEYSYQFAKKTTEYYFIDHSKIYGKEILSFCDIKQVNLLIIKVLFNKWQQEAQKLRSPYFDFQQPEVQEALKLFMNTLSKHIAVSKADFQPLVEQACKDALMLLLNPYDFFKQDFDLNPQDYIDKERLKNTIKYIQFNKELLRSYAQKIEWYNQLDKTTAWRLFEEAYQLHEDSLEPVEWRIRSFSEIYLLDLNALYEPEVTPESNVFDYPSKASIFAESYASGDVYASKLIATHEQEQKTYNNQSTNTSSIDNNPELEKPTANITDKFRKSKIETIRRAISLNQKFIFINQLFGGNNLAFNEAIDRIEQCKSYEEARNLINSDYAIRFQWNYQQPEAHQFLDLVERRFTTEK